MDHVPSRICPLCDEFLPHYCAAVVKVATTRLPTRQGQRPKWRKTVYIRDRMPPYEEVKSSIVVNTGR